MSEIGTRPTNPVPTWASTGTVTVPSGAKKLIGWIANEIPPFGTFNWFWNRVGEWLTYLKDSHVRQFTTLETASTNVTDNELFIVNATSGAIGEVEYTVAPSIAPVCVNMDGTYVQIGHKASSGKYITVYSADLSSVVNTMDLGALTWTVEAVTDIQSYDDDFLLITGSYDTYAHGSFIALVARDGSYVEDNWDTANSYGSKVVTDGEKHFGILTHAGSSSLKVINASSGVVEATTAIAGPEIMTEISTDGSYVYVAGQDTKIGIYDRSGTLITLISIGGGAGSPDITGMIAGDYGIALIHDAVGAGSWTADDAARCFVVTVPSPIQLHNSWVLNEPQLSVSGHEPSAICYDGKSIWIAKSIFNAAGNNPMLVNIDPSTGAIRSCLLRDDTLFAAINDIDCDGTRLVLAGLDSAAGPLLSVTHTGRNGCINYKRLFTVERHDSVRKLYSPRW